MRLFVLWFAAAAAAASAANRIPLVHKYGSHHVVVEISDEVTETQQQLWIVDTGSSITYGKCTLPPLPAPCVFALSHLRDGVCELSVAYTEESAWTGYEVRGPLKLGDSISNSTFTCLMRAEGQIVSQFADGILGLQPSEATMTRSFRLCLGVDGGWFEPVAAKHSEPNIAVTELVSTKSYQVMIESIALGDIVLCDLQYNAHVLGNLNRRAVIDSGTTDTYLHSSIKHALHSAWLQIVGSRWPLDDKEADLPDLIITLSGNVTLTMPSTRYLEDGEPRVYTTGMYGAVFGGNAMMDHMIHFDVDNQLLGIVPANCDEQLASISL